MTIGNSHVSINIMEPAKILIVEDDDFLREIYVEILQQEGYNVNTAVDGEDALEKIKEGGYDLVLLDIIMPKLDGLSVMKQIKNDPNAKPNKRLIFLTNLDNDAQIKEALELGDGYLIKSQLTPDNLLKEVKLNLAKN